MEAPEFIAICFLLCILCIVKWYYETSEKKFNNFIQERIRKRTREELENKSSRQIKIEEELRGIGNPITYDKLSQYSKLIMIVPTVVLFMVRMPFLAVIPLVVGYKFPELYITRKKDQKIELFSEGLADALSQLLAIIQAGQTQMQGFKVLSEMPYPIGTEFGRIYHDINTGASLKQALDDFYERIPLTDIRLFNIGAIISAKATPAVTISTLKTIISTIQKRDSQKKSIKSTVMSGQMTAIILGAMPVVVFLGLETLMPDLINEFLSTGTGKLMIVLAAILDGIGYYFARRITSANRMIQY